LTHTGKREKASGICRQGHYHRKHSSPASSNKPDKPEGLSLRKEKSEKVRVTQSELSAIKYAFLRDKVAWTFFSH
jgi:hypothetical protein